MSAIACYLPPYSPDLNLIENAFAKLKTLIRSAAERTIDGLQQQIREALDTFSETECAITSGMLAMRKTDQEKLFCNGH